jgi:Na+/H+ antiporter NhaD/arsenite permease-like protein
MIKFLYLFLIIGLKDPLQATNLYPNIIMPTYGMLPFFTLLLGIALGPVLLKNIWHRIENKFLGLTLLSTALIFSINNPFPQTRTALLSVIIHEYVPFILVIAALYICANLIHIKVSGIATPLRNMTFLICGGLLSSVIGTTGASILLIRPFLEFNQDRHNKVHLVIFFILTVSNIGGALTPLGDPPLFIGYLYGVNFFWTTLYLLIPYLIVMFFVTTAFWMLDNQFYKIQFNHMDKPSDKVSTTIDGKIYMTAIATIIVFILLGSKNFGVIDTYGISLNISHFIRDLGIAATIGVLLFSKSKIKKKTTFHWAPLHDVSKVFFCIFVCLLPVSLLLNKGSSGPFSGLFNILNSNGTPNPFAYFWLTGIFSSFLDNAPTYALFFKLTNLTPQNLMVENRLVLEAISLSSVFFGAMTYIGNAPNFMVAHIAKQYGVPMPTFFGYILWPLVILTPIFLGLSYFWFIY